MCVTTQEEFDKAVLDGAELIETLPVGTCKRSPEGFEAILTDDADTVPWYVYKAGGMETDGWLADDEVADWEVITDAPQAVIDADKLAKSIVLGFWGEVVEPDTGARYVDISLVTAIADAIRADLPDATVPADRILGPTQAAIDVSELDDLVARIADAVMLRITATVDEAAAHRADLARRGESL